MMPKQLVLLPALAVFLLLAVHLPMLQAGSIYFPVKVEDCYGNPVRGMKVSFYGCVDAAGTHTRAVDYTQGITATTDSNGYVDITNNQSPCAGNRGFQAHFCYGSGGYPCSAKVISASVSGSPNPDRYDILNLFTDDYPNTHFRQYVLNSGRFPCSPNPPVNDNQCNDRCGTMQACYQGGANDLVMRPRNCPTSCPPS